LFVGVFILQSGWIDSWQLQSGAVLHTFIDRAINPISILASNIFPDWSIFLLGLGIILLSFKLFDKCLPQMALKESQVGMVSRLVYHPMVMFMLGASITMISMSVSLSLSILVPLSQRGFVRRENVIPYIMGANITTFTDTLFAAALLDNPLAFTIVLAEMASIAVVSIVVLSTIRVPYQRTLLNMVGWVTSSNPNMVVFMVIIFVIPLILFFLD
jgi:Na+/phosphate symporter